MRQAKATLFILFLLSATGTKQCLATEIAGQVPPSREEINLSYAKVVKKVAPAVVNIYTFQHPKTKLPNSPFLSDPFFRQFFERLQPGLGVQQVALGSGVIINKEGYILTNYHVIKDSDEIRIILSDKEEYIAKPITMDKRSDLALLKIDSKKEFPYLMVSPQEDLEVGDVVLAIGNPFGIGQTVTHGIVSALARGQEGISDFRSFIQTDAAINPGNSGGALVTTDGRLVGINTAIYSKSGGSMGIGFAIPSTLALPVIESIKNGGHIIRPWIGAEVESLPTETIQGVALGHSKGVLVKSIYPEGPAYHAGIIKGDIISALDGQEIWDKAALDYQVAISPIGKKATIKILRDGKEQNLSIQLAKPMEAKDPHPFTIEGDNPLQGVKIRIISPALALDMGLNPMENGLVITEVSSKGAATQLGVLPGDILVSINKKTVTTKKEVLSLLKVDKKSWDIVLRRGDKLLSFQVNEL